MKAVKEGGIHRRLPSLSRLPLSAVFHKKGEVANKPLNWAFSHSLNTLISCSYSAGLRIRTPFLVMGNVLPLFISRTLRF